LAGWLGLLLLYFPPLSSEKPQAFFGVFYCFCLLNFAQLMT
jgi:hypothetical protein